MAERLLLLIEVPRLHGPLLGLEHLPLDHGLALSRLLSAWGGALAILGPHDEPTQRKPRPRRVWQVA